MGFKIPRRTALLTFEGTDYDGAEVRVRLDVSLGYFLSIEEMVRSKHILQLYTLFGDETLESWNLENGGGPLSANAEGMKALPPALANIILNSWMEAVAKLPTPLSKRSKSGSTSAGHTTRKAKR